MIAGLLNKFRGANRAGFGHAKKPQPHELHVAMEEIVDQGRSLQSLVDHSGYKVLRAALQERFDLLQKDLRKAKMIDVTRLQAQLTELEFVLNFVPDSIEHAANVERELSKQEDESDE